MDNARDFLHSQAGETGFISGLLNWLSDQAFGASRGQGGFGEGYKEWLLQMWSVPAEAKYRRTVETSERRRAAAAAAVVAQPEAVASMAALLFMSEERVGELVERYPQILSIPPADVAQRLLALKQLLPWSDVSAMVELHPQLLGCEAGYVKTVVKRRLQALIDGMPGADLATMMQDHPWVLLEDVEAALPRLHELWPGLDAEAFGNSSPSHLALALRAMARDGPLPHDPVHVRGP